MLIERCAYASRWRYVSPAAKGGFALAGLVAALAAPTPVVALAVAGVLLAVAVVGAGVPIGAFLRVAAPASGFLVLSAASLLVSLSVDASGVPSWRYAPEMLPAVALLAARSLAALVALLGLVMSTPLPDLIALLRRLRVPEVLLDLMVLSYRLLFVLSESLRDTYTAQAARLGHGSGVLRLRSLGGLVASLSVQVWTRAQALQQAADARNGDGPLRFLPPRFEHARVQTALALFAGTALVVAVLGAGP